MISVIIMNAILIVIAVLLLIAEKFLVTYGECKITVDQDDGKKEILVQGGMPLISYLTEHKINISSSCGGKATCGYCKIKVLNGGGLILPTEEIFMSRQERIMGMRLACQVKVKNNIEIHVPDFLSTIKSMVENHNYNPHQKWKFRVSGQKYNIPVKKQTVFSTEDTKKISEIINMHKDRKGALVPVLQSVNAHFNYLPEPVLKNISVNLKIPLSNVYGVATFYNAFSLVPKGKYVINICTGTACHVKGSFNLISTLETTLGIKMGETTEDMLFTLQSVRCLGCCGIAPVMKINEDIHGFIDRKKSVGLIEKIKKNQMN